MTPQLVPKEMRHFILIFPLFRLTWVVPADADTLADSPVSAILTATPFHDGITATFHAGRLIDFFPSKGRSGTGRFALAANWASLQIFAGHSLAFAVKTSTLMLI
jgi:hypothetical protein